MVAAKGDEAGESFAGFRVPRQVRVCGWSAGQEVMVALFYLLKGVGVVVGGDGDVATVEDGCPAMEWVCIEGHVIAAVKVKTTRALPYACRSESGTRTVRCPSIERGTNEGNVKFLGVARETREIWQTSESADAREDRIGLYQGLASLRGSIGRSPDLCASISR